MTQISKRYKVSLDFIRDHIIRGGGKIRIKHGGEPLPDIPLRKVEVFGCHVCKAPITKFRTDLCRFCNGVR